MGNHIWTLGSKQIPRKRNCQAKDMSKEEEEEEEAPHDLCHTIPHPNGEAGWGGDSGRGFNIQNLIGLSEDLENSKVHAEEQEEQRTQTTT